MRGKLLQGLMLFSAISALVWVVGLAWTLQHYFFGGDPVVLPTPTTAAQPVQAAPVSTPTPQQGTYKIVGLGDSLTRGFGDPDGKGYAGRVADLMKAKTSQTIGFDNLGVNGQTSVQLVSMLQLPDVQEKVKTAQMLLLSIGGNDLFRGGETLVNLDRTKVAALQTDYNKQFNLILTQLRKLNANAPTYLIGLYNPFIELQDSATTSKIVRDWNYAAGETLAAYPKTVLVPTFDLFQNQTKNLLYIDQFHPNAEGYRLMAERIADSISGQGGSR